jgi:co-chaperonin GroES (HSP10)
MIKEMSLLDNQKSTTDKIADINGFEIKGWNLLVQPVEVSAETKLGILMPESVKEDMEYLNNVCRVLAVGSKAYTQESFSGEAWCKVGDYVLIPKHTGTRILLK